MDRTTGEVAATNEPFFEDVTTDGNEPEEFFLNDDLVVPTVEDAPFEEAAPFEETAPLEEAAPLEFFMIGDADDLAADEFGAAVEGAPQPAPDYPAPGVIRRPQMNSAGDWGSSPTTAHSTGLGYSGEMAEWATVPSPGLESPRGFRGCVNAAICACQARWVNWRHGSDYLEGCIPEGFNGFLTINVTSPSQVYSSPLSSNGPIQPSSGIDASVQTNERLNRSMALLTTNINPDPARVTDPEYVPDADAVGPEVEPFWHYPGTHRGWNGMAYYWDASHLIHQPLYFEDVNLERAGYSYGILQPAVSAARFYSRLPLLPYALAVHPHYKAVYPLGEFRPGSPAPYVCDRPPLSLHGSAVEAAVVTGLFFAIP